MLLGVEAPAVRPTVTGPAGSQPREIVSSTAAVEGAPIGRWRISLSGSEHVGVGDVEGRRPAGADRRQVAGVAAVVAADHDHQAGPVLVEQREDRVLALLRRAADRVERPEARATVRPRRSGRASPAAASPPISSDSLISIVVWFAQPMRARCAVGIEPGRHGLAEAREKRRRGRRRAGCSRRRAAASAWSSTTRKWPSGKRVACEAVARVSSWWTLPWMTAVKPSCA